MGDQGLRPLEISTLPEADEAVSLANVLSRELTGTWAISTEDEIRREFPQDTRAYSLLQCFKEEAKNGRKLYAPSKCKCTEHDLCQRSGHQKCGGQDLSYSTLTKRYVVKGPVLNTESKIGDASDGRTGEGGELGSKTLASSRRLLNAVRGRSLCWIGDSTALNMYNAIKNEFSRHPSLFSVNE